MLSKVCSNFFLQTRKFAASPNIYIYIARTTSLHSIETFESVLNRQNEALKLKCKSLKGELKAVEASRYTEEDIATAREWDELRTNDPEGFYNTIAGASLEPKLMTLIETVYPGFFSMRGKHFYSDPSESFSS